MANLQGVLGAMLASRMAGRGRRGGPLGGPDLLGGLAGGFGGGMGGMGGLGGIGGMGARRGGGGGLARTAGLATLGYLAYKSINQSQNRAPSGHSGSGAQQGGLGGLLGALTGDGGRSGAGGRSERNERSLGDRLGDALGSGHEEEMPEGAAELGDDKALLLIRAMIAAANADGSISGEERERILSKLDEAGADRDDRRLIERELQQPRALEDLLREVRDPETAQQFYLASRAAIGGDTRTEQSYLTFLRDRLQLDQAEAEELERLA